MSFSSWWPALFGTPTTNSAEATSPSTPGAVPRILRSLEHVRAAGIVGEQPTDELHVEPRWLVFRSDEDFQHESYSEFTLHNRDAFPVAYSIRSKALNIFGLVPRSYGFLRAGETKTFKLCVNSCDDWARSTDEVMALHKMRILVANIRVPENIRPLDDKSAYEMARLICNTTRERNPCQRLYTKMDVVLEREPEL